MIKTKRIYLRRFTKNEADLLFQLDGDADVMKYITLGIPRTMDEVIEKSMPRYCNLIKTNQILEFLQHI